MHFVSMVLFLVRVILWLIFETIMEYDGQKGIDSMVDLDVLRPMILWTIGAVVFGLCMVIFVDIKWKKEFFMICETNYGFFEKTLITVMYLYFFDDFGLKYVKTS